LKATDQTANAWPRRLYFSSPVVVSQTFNSPAIGRIPSPDATASRRPSGLASMSQIVCLHSASTEMSAPLSKSQSEITFPCSDDGEVVAGRIADPTRAALDATAMRFL